MKKPFVLFAIGLLLVSGLGGKANADPVVQVVEISGHRPRFDMPGPAFVRYLLIDPSNADPAVDGFPPLDPVAILMVFTGGDGRLNL